MKRNVIKVTCVKDLTSNKYECHFDNGKKETILKTYKKLKEVHLYSKDITDKRLRMRGARRYFSFNTSPPPKFDKFYMKTFAVEFI